MGFSMMLVFLKVGYTRGNIAMVLTGPGQVSLYTLVCIERKGNDAGRWFQPSPGYDCCLCYCCPISIEERKRFYLSIYLHCSLCAYRLQPKGLIDSLYFYGSTKLNNLSCYQDDAA